MLIVLEGANCSGKGTIQNLLATHLENAGYQVKLTAEPTSFDIGAMVRQRIQGNGIKDNLTWLLLFLADRREHNLRMQEWISEGKVVICDRYTISTYVYQYFLRESPPEIGNILRSLDPVWLVPDVSFVLKCRPETLAKRLKERNRENPAIYERSLETVSRVAEYYENIVFYLENARLGKDLIDNLYVLRNNGDDPEDPLRSIISLLRLDKRMKI